MNEMYKVYVDSIIESLKERALDARSNQRSEDTDFNAGRLMAYYEVISILQNRTVALDIKLEDLRLDDIDPNRDLV